MTALMVAVVNGHSEIAKVLLDNGANVNYKNKVSMALITAVDAVIAK
ncbi:MAG: ankyrin repeat domain-containing protein [Gammaproteobacteria bacterium WSBS_2016_MAG_OTU1]